MRNCQIGKILQPGSQALMSGAVMAVGREMSRRDVGESGSIRVEERMISYQVTSRFRNVMGRLGLGSIVSASPKFPGREAIGMR